MPQEPPGEIGWSELWEAFKERSSWWIPGLIMFGGFYGFTFFLMMLFGALKLWPFKTIFFATNITMLLTLPMGAVMIWLNRTALFEKLATPEGKPDYTLAQNMEHKSRWHEAIGEYRRVSREFPLDAEVLWRIAMIHRDRLGDEDGYLAALQEIVRLPDDAQPAWILNESRDRLLRLDDAEPGVEPTVERPTEIELPDEERPWGRFGPEDL